ncbi:MAG: glycosyltransferase family 4 protein [Pseudomonadota bacterium]
MSTLVLILLLLAVALLSAWLVGRLIKFLNQHQIVDTANDRSLHQGSVPRGGGLVIATLLFLSLIFMAIYTERYAVFSGLATSVFAWATLSWWDDQHDLSPRRRLLFQLSFAALILLAFGYVTEIRISDLSSIQLYGLGTVITFIGLMWFTNLYNFMDGMDGLAASQSVIAAITLAFWFWQAGDPHLSLVCLLLAASCYGFLWWNWQPAKIFMGDVGSITLGSFFGVMIIFANTRYQIPVISLVLLFGVFVFDASLTILRRILRREQFWLPHRSHYYQRLALCGFDHAKIVTSMIILMVICSLIASATVLDHDRIVPGAVVELLVLLLSAGFVVRQERKK